MIANHEMNSLLLIDAEFCPVNLMQWNQNQQVWAQVIAKRQRLDRCLLMDRATAELRLRFYQLALSQHCQQAEDIPSQVSDLINGLKQQNLTTVRHLIWLTRQPEHEAEATLKQALKHPPIELQLREELQSHCISSPCFGADAQRLGFYLWRLSNGLLPNLALSSQDAGHSGSALSPRSIKARLNSYSSGFRSWVFSCGQPSKVQQTNQALLPQLEITWAQYQWRLMRPKAKVFVQQRDQWQEKTASSLIKLVHQESPSIMQSIEQQHEQLPIFVQFNGALELRMRQPWFAQAWSLLQASQRPIISSPMSLLANLNFGEDALLLSLDPWQMTQTVVPTILKSRLTSASPADF